MYVPLFDFTLACQCGVSIVKAVSFVCEIDSVGIHHWSMSLKICYNISSTCTLKMKENVMPLRELYTAKLEHTAFHINQRCRGPSLVAGGEAGFPHTVTPTLPP